MVWLSRASGLGGIFKNSLKMNARGHPAFSLVGCGDLERIREVIVLRDAVYAILFENYFSIAGYL